MLTDAKLYMECLIQIDALNDRLESGIFDTRTPDSVAHDLRVRRKQLQDLKALITGAATDLPHS